MNAFGDEHAMQQIAKVIESINVLCDQQHRTGEYEHAMTLAVQGDEQANQWLPKEHELRLTCALNVAATGLKLDRREQVKSSLHRALEVDRCIRKARLVRGHTDLGLLSPSHRHDLGRITQLLKILADWAEEVSDFAEAASILGQLVSYHSLLSGEDHWKVADIRLKLGRCTLEAELGHEQRDQLRESIRINNQVVDSYARGEFEKAFALLKQSWRIVCRLTPQRHFLRSDIMKNAAALHRVAGRLRQADRRFRECVSIQGEWLTQWHPTYASTLREHAEVVRGLGNYAAAEEMLKRATEVTGVSVGKETNDYATCLNDLAVHFHYEARYDDAERGYRSAIDVFESIQSNSPLFVHALNNLGAVLLRKQQYREAEATLRRALEVCEQLGIRGRGYLQAMQALADAYHETGDSGQAQQQFRAVIALLEERNGREHYSVASPLAALAQSLQGTGDYRGGEELIQRALAIVRRVDSDGARQELASLLRLLGVHFIHLQDWGEASSHFQQALSIQREQFDRHPSIAKTLDDLGAVEEQQGNLDRALELYKEASEIWNEFHGEMHRDYAMSLNHIGLLYQKQGDLTTAEKHLRRALEIRSVILGTRHHDFAASANNLAYCLNANGDVEGAARFYEVACSAYEQAYVDGHPHLADCLNNLSMTYANLDDWQRAQECAERAFEMADRYLRQRALISSESQRLAQLDAGRASLDSYVSLLLLNPNKNQKSINAACNAVLRRKGVSAEVLNLLRDWVLDGRYPELTPARELVRSLRKQIVTQISTASGGPEGSQRLQQLQRDLDRLEADLARKIPEEELHQQLVRADLSSVAAALPKDTALIEISETLIYPMGSDKWELGDDGKPFFRYLAFVLHPEHPMDAQFVDLGEVLEINSLASEFIEAVVEEGNAATDSVAARQAQERVEFLGDRLRRAIFDPLKPLLGDVTKIIISPDGELHRLPFEILPTVNERFLIDDYHFSYVGVGRDVIRFGQQSGTAPNAALVIADPDFNLSMASDAPIGAISLRQSRDKPQLGSFQSLPGARMEGEEVAELLGVAPWLSENALEGRLRHRPSPIVLHIATHGFFLPSEAMTQRTGGRDLMPSATGNPVSTEIENPLLRSGLALAGANTFLTGKPLPEEAEDGLLNAEDIGCLDLFDTELVVLSACQTGRGAIRTGEGVFGLRRSFAIAGAKTMVMSLWKVPDLETRRLMVDFYTRLIAGERRRDALRQAQLGLRRLSRPFFWGAFVCVGAVETVSGLASRKRADQDEPKGAK